MPMLPLILVCAAVLLVAYRYYGALLARLLRLDPKAATPAVELRDDVDYVPIEPKFLLGQHFSAIAAAGPIVGPILAGAMFGWLPALLWILLGSILIGGVHDIGSLVASIRHKARSIAEVVRDNMTRRSYVLFLTFIWLALVYIIVAFTDVTASAFVGEVKMENGQSVSGPGIATSSLLYLALPIAMGLLLRFTRLSLMWATLIFLPLVGVSIWAGQLIPLDLQAIFGLEKSQAVKLWDLIILLYCLIAAVVPMWLLLQPRGHLGGYFLYAALAAAGIGVLFAFKPILYPAFLGFESAKGEMLFPMLFITIACGACSGFHSLIASGTTSKQLKRETDAKIIGYGSMLLEGMVAVISLSCVMMLARDSKLLTNPQPNVIYASGIGSFLESFGVPATYAISFALMAFTTFVYDTLDVCTRLGRYIIQELIGWRDKKGAWLGTALTAGVPVFFVMQTTFGPDGQPMPAWRVFWALFGASNQLLAALTLLGLTVWLWRSEQAQWVWPIFGLPTIVMYVMSLWALLRIVISHLQKNTLLTPVPIVATILSALALLMLAEAVKSFGGGRPKKARPLEAAHSTG